MYLCYAEEKVWNSFAWQLKIFIQHSSWRRFALITSFQTPFQNPFQTPSKSLPHRSRNAKLQLQPRRGLVGGTEGKTDIKMLNAGRYKKGGYKKKKLLALKIKKASRKMYNLLCSRLFFSFPPPQQQFASVVFWGGPAHLKNWPGEKLQLCVVLVQGAWQVKGHRTFQACNALGQKVQECV